MSGVLSRKFYQRPTVEVARDLLGKLLVRELDDGGRLVDSSTRLGGGFLLRKAMSVASGPGKLWVESLPSDLSVEASAEVEALAKVGEIVSS